MGRTGSVRLFEAGAWIEILTIFPGFSIKAVPETGDGQLNMSTGRIPSILLPGLASELISIRKFEFPDENELH